MKATQKKIVEAAIELFNQHGVATVRVQDIAKTAGISPGNLTYHFKTKKDLTAALCLYMKEALAQLTYSHQILMKPTDWIELTKAYLNFQIQFRFFYRDTLEIIRLYPATRDFYKKQIQKIINFNKNALFLAVGRGYIISETFEGQYETLAKNVWAVLNSWLTQREILGQNTINIQDGIRALLDLHYPYFSEKGKAFYYTMLKELPTLVKKEFNLES